MKLIKRLIRCLLESGKIYLNAFLKLFPNSFDAFEDSLFQLNEIVIVRITWRVDAKDSQADWGHHLRNNAEQIQ